MIEDSEPDAVTEVNTNRIASGSEGESREEKNVVAEWPLELNWIIYSNINRSTVKLLTGCWSIYLLT